MKTLQAQFDIAYPNFDLQVDLTIPAQGVTAVFGPSGCGKTTLLRCLAGLERASGYLQFGDRIWQDDQESVFVSLSRRPIGYVFQDAQLFPHLDVRANLLFGFKRTKPQARRLSLEQVVQILDLGSLLTRRPAQLSGGEAQRVAIGRALLTSPELLLMDEPLSSLDVQRKREILAFIQRLDAELGIPIIYITHALQEVLQLAKTLILLQNGRVTAMGPVDQVFARLDTHDLNEESHIGAIIDAVVEAHEPEFSLTKLAFRERHLYVPYQEKAVGAHLRVQILSRDVSIVTSPPALQSSVLNIFEAIVTAIGKVDPEQPFVDVELDIGCPLVATITRKSLMTLNLHLGQAVYAQIKTVALSQDILV